MSGNNQGGAKGDNAQQPERKKQSILDLQRFLEKQIRVKFAGGRECSGVLKVNVYECCTNVH